MREGIGIERTGGEQNSLKRVGRLKVMYSAKKDQKRRAINRCVEESSDVNKSSRARESDKESRPCYDAAVTLDFSQ